MISRRQARPIHRPRPSFTPRGATGAPVARHVDPGHPVLTISGLRVSRRSCQVLRDIQLAVARGEFVALMGPSGAGKTTVLRTILGLEGFEAGTVRIGDLALAPGPCPAGAALAGLRRLVGMVFQFHHLFEHLTALENVALAPVHVLGIGRSEAEARARALLSDLGVGARAGALPRALSGGEAQRVAIARALAMDPPLLVLDEPTASLDPARRADLGGVLRRLLAQGRAILCASHDGDFVRDFADRVAVLSEGEVVEDGPPESVFGHPTHLATKRLLCNI